ncbi:hypothetical protein PG991_006349 [Apiospora marii]|uniref:NWD NACHT-NTPase N-terminal domain-containing protein n=1 Tax=Apiospora marii TaxID=335849 RepID=A0ABR1SDC2_9PEZI
MPHPEPPRSQVILPASEVKQSLWSRAYDVLRDEDEQLVERYEKLLSRELEGHGTSHKDHMQSTPHQEAELDNTGNRIDANPDNRRTQLQRITEEGLRRMDERQTKYIICGHVFVVRDQIAQAVKLIQAFKDLVTEAVKVSPEASLAWAGVSILLPVLTNPSAAKEANREGLSYVTSRTRYYVELESLLWPGKLDRIGVEMEFESHIVELYRLILEFQIKTVLRFYRRWLSTLGRDLIRHDDWEGMLSNIKRLEGDVYKESIRINTIASQSTLEAIWDEAKAQHAHMESLISVTENILAEHKRTNQILENRPLNLPVVHEARQDSADVQDSPKCEVGTRIRIQETIDQWADEESGQSFFWLVGPAGTGKSTIARTVADSFKEKNRLAAGYFFKRGEQGRNDTNRLFTTIAIQIAEVIPTFQDYLQKALHGIEKDAVAKLSLEAQFNRLFLRLNVPHPDTTSLSRLIIIDALDECERPGHIKRVIDLLLKLCKVTWARLRVLFTSRSAPSIVHAFEPLLRENSARRLALHRAFSEDTKADIEKFLKTRFDDLKSNGLVDDDSWPASSDLDRLVQMATSPQPLFIYAATFCRFLYDEHHPNDPVEQLRLWLEQRGGSKSQIQQIYDPILNQVFRGSEKAKVDQRLQFLGALVLLATPLPASALATLLGMGNVNWWLRELHAVLDIPTEPQIPTRLLHKSFSDFLLSSGDSNTGVFRVEASQIHTLLATKCIQRMTAGLKQDICDIRKPDATRDDVEKTTIDRCIPPELQYACINWVDHLKRSGRSFDNDIYTFLYNHLLHWLETLSILGHLREGVDSVRELFKLVKGFENIPPEFIDFVNDANRVISRFGSLIERIPLQVYGALILLSPVASKVRQKLWDQRMPKLSTVQGVRPDWDTHLQALEGHRAGVSVVAFSPDGRLLASGSLDNTVRVWNLLTGTHLQTLEGHSSSISAVAFSPSGHELASGSYDNTVKIWNVRNGHLLQTLQGHSGYIAGVAFSPDSELLASGSFDSSLRLWNAKTGLQLNETVMSPRYTRIAFSPDMQLVSAARLDCTIRVWDSATGSRRKTLIGHRGTIKTIAFSPNGKLIASGSWDGTVRIWNVRDGTQKFMIETHDGAVRVLAFSSESQLLASVTARRVTVWNTKTGTKQSTFEYHGPLINTVDVSPDGQFIATGCTADPTIQLWESGSFEREVPKRSSDGHDALVKTRMLSPDAQITASTSRDREVPLWDVSTGLCQRIFENHTIGVQQVALSPDSKLLASFEQPAHVWSVGNGSPQQTLDNANGLVRAVAYSPNGKLAASAMNHTIKLHDLINGACLLTYEGPSGHLVGVITFSYNNQILASCSNESTIRLWDTRTGIIRHILEAPGLTGTRPMIIFSYNNRLLAVVGHKQMSFWDVATGERLPLGWRDLGQVTAAAFSSDSQLLATARKTGYGGQVIELWDMTTKAYRNRLADTKGYYTNILFSPDGQLIAAVSQRTAICIWSAITDTLLYTFKILDGIITKIEFSPDAKMMASASTHKTIRLWDITTGAQLQVMQYDQGLVREMNFLPHELVVSVSIEIDDYERSAWRPKALQSHRYDITPELEKSGISDSGQYGAKLDMDEEWIVNGSGKVVWLPPEYRPSRTVDKAPWLPPDHWSASWASTGSTVFIDCVSGRVIKFQAC